MKKYTLNIVEDPETPGELLLDLGNEVCDELGWKPGDTVEWIKQDDGKWTLQKKTESGN